MRELLAGAFQMPAAATGPDEETSDNDEHRYGSSASPPTDAPGGREVGAHEGIGAVVPGGSDAGGPEGAGTGSPGRPGPDVPGRHGAGLPVRPEAGAHQHPEADTGDGRRSGSPAHRRTDSPAAHETNRPGPHRAPVAHARGSAAAPDLPAPSHSATPQAPTPSDPPPPATPHVPRSMAAPDRDGELRRTFPAFPPRPSDDQGFAETWWGNAWVSALEEGALDAKRLARGRGYAEQGQVDAITVTPGLLLAYVQGSRPRPYRVQVRLRTLDDADWARFLDAAADRPGHIAALLDKEMPQSLAQCGVPLLPGPGDLDPRCSCPDSGHPCKHAAALCYQTARLLDADPFVLLLLRGRGERDVLDALSRRSAARAARAAGDR
ncbi:SWIM zinc finger family protein, partial [Streptomyces sp. TRM68367]|uniref:SWIM zinc finger family protein n=1 Tax=Streptomyces sp. TRM68367 TaxID=2758415 RepID=UPI0037DD4538